MNYINFDVEMFKGGVTIYQFRNFKTRVEARSFIDKWLSERPTATLCGFGYNKSSKHFVEVKE